MDPTIVLLKDTLSKHSPISLSVRRLLRLAGSWLIGRGRLGGTDRGPAGEVVVL